LILLKSSDPKSLSFLETKSLDGETNLKIKNVPKPLQKIINLNYDANLEYEPPNSNLYHF